MEEEDVQQAFKDFMDELERNDMTVTDFALVLIDAYLKILEEKGEKE